MQEQMAQILGPDPVIFRSRSSHKPSLSAAQGVVDGVEKEAQSVLPRPPPISSSPVPLFRQSTQDQRPKMSSLPEPPPGLDLDETKVPALVSAAALTWVFGVISVCLRITSRRLIRYKLWWDDWLIVISLVFSPLNKSSPSSLETHD
ncbi:hypothetical protein HZ326_19419 [Fusarium oxysporum f. sp. albedinis]|nr:hypothetical protein HZ326_19419 [Fusarium oxysporum f. sp. albedinis]